MRSRPTCSSRGNRLQVVLDELARALDLPGPPHRVEGFDISTIQGSETVASMVVWQDGEMKKDDYKRYRIRTVTGTDDFASMREVLTRRYGRALEGEGVFPDLILLDGGRGQLHAGMKALEDLGLDYVPIAALAKRAEEVYVPERLEPLVLDLARPRSRRSRKFATRRIASPSPTTRSCASGGPSRPCWTRFPAWGRPSGPTCSRRWDRRKSCGRRPWPSSPPCRR